MGYRCPGILIRGSILVVLGGRAYSLGGLLWHAIQRRKASLNQMVPLSDLANNRNFRSTFHRFRQDQNRGVQQRGETRKENNKVDLLSLAERNRVIRSFSHQGGEGLPAGPQGAFYRFKALRYLALLQRQPTSPSSQDNGYQLKRKSGLPGENN